MPPLKAILDANILITKIQLEMSRKFSRFQESIPFSRETQWLFDTYSRKTRFVMVPNVELTILERFRKETLLIHELQNKLFLRKGEEFRILEKFLHSDEMQLEDSVIKMAFLHYKEQYAYFQTFKRKRFEELMKKKARDLKRLYYKILNRYNFEIYREILKDDMPDETIERFSDKILDATFISYKGDKNKRRKYLEREDREILCDVFEYCQKFKRRDFNVIFLTNDRIIIKERSKIETLGGSSFTIRSLLELYGNELKYGKL